MPDPLDEARDLARRLGALPFVDVVWLFGSAARGTLRRGGDLDLAVSAPGAGPTQWAMVEEVVEDAPTLRRVDVLRWEELRASDPLRASILRDRVVLFERVPGLAERDDDFAASHARLGEAMARLAEGLAVLAAGEASDLARDGVVQRFEFTLEQFWKTLRHALEAVGLEPGPAPRTVLRAAAAQGWIADEPKAWDAVISDRNRTSHTYRREIAEDVLSRVPAHLARIQAVAERLPALVEGQAG